MGGGNLLAGRIARESSGSFASGIKIRHSAFVVPDKRMREVYGALHRAQKRGDKIRNIYIHTYILCARAMKFRVARSMMQEAAFLSPRGSISASSRYARRADQFLDRPPLCNCVSSGLPLQTIMAPPVTAVKAVVLRRRSAAALRWRIGLEAVVKLKGLPRGNAGTIVSEATRPAVSPPLLRRVNFTLSSDEKPIFAKAAGRRSTFCTVNLNNDYLIIYTIIAKISLLFYCLSNFIKLMTLMCSIGTIRAFKFLTAKHK